MFLESEVPISMPSQGLSTYEESSLRQTLKRLLFKVHPGSSNEDLNSLVEENFPFAASRYSEYEQVFADCRVALLRLNAHLRKMEELLKTSQESDSAFGVKLFFSKLERANIEAEDLRKLTNIASRCWYNIGDEPSITAYIEASDKLEELSVRGTEAAEHYKLDLGRLSQGQHPLTTITVEREKKPALHYDAGRVIGLKFSGEGPSTEVLRLYSVFKKKWAQIKEDIESNYGGCSNVIIFEKFKDCLEGKAHLLASEAATYELALEELDRTYENSFKLAKAYLDEVKAGSSIQDLQKTSKTALYQVQKILEEA